MTSTLQSPYTNQQISVWFRGLLTIAWADGNFDLEEKNLITSLTNQDLAAIHTSKALDPVSPAELAEAFGHDPAAAEHFLRMAVMVAIADGVYSSCEDEILFRYCQSLGLSTDVLEVLRTTLNEPQSDGDVPVERPPLPEQSHQTMFVSGIERPLHSYVDLHPHPTVLQPVRDWLDKMDVQDPRIAHFLCKLIPSQCPFERDINLFGRTIAHIPPLCKLNPLYDQLVSLRFRALSYLADDCGEDVSPYC
ncbi:MAG: nitrogenase [Lyngbya sp. HA4199-MV5]|jgi:tellurite resistance protein|nr:nitrogenase [Lyngbya sp. HA4199-MV5]